MQRLKTLYLKSRVIQLAPELPFIMADMTLQTIEDYKKTDNFKNPFGFEQALFLAECIKRWRIDQSQLTRVEKHYYNKSVEQFNKFHELHQFITQLEELAKNIDYVYLRLSMEQAASNVASYKPDTSEDIAKQLEETISEYNRIDKQLEEYPEWQTKLRDEVGRYINMIYSQHVENPSLEKILGNFDRHQYFK